MGPERIVLRFWQSTNPEFRELSFSITFEFLAVGICVTNSLIGLSSIQPCKESFGYNYYNYYNIYFLLLLFLYVVYWWNDMGFRHMHEYISGLVCFILSSWPLRSVFFSLPVNFIFSVIHLLTHWAQSGCCHHLNCTEK